jgi:hypothetical protein
MAGFLASAISHPLKWTAMKYILLFVAFSIGGLYSSLYAQTHTPTPQLDSLQIAPFVYPFEFEDGKWQGPGAEQLREMVQQSQFFVLGEFHGSAQTGFLVEQLAPLLQEAGYSHFACEVGPHSAQMLTALSHPPSKTLQRLQAFNQQYYCPTFDDTAIPFFDGIEDAKFLQAIAEAEMDIWGLDQEYYSAHSFLFDQLLETAKDQSNYPELVRLEQEADSIAWGWLYLEDEDEEGFPVFDSILQEPVVREFFSGFAGNERGEAIIKDLKISWDIYNRYKGGVSHGDRIRYMRNNFRRNYEAAKLQVSKPKVFVKVGQVHASKVLSLGELDVGNLTQQIALEEGTRSANVAVWKRYQQDGDIVIDLLEQHSRYFKRNLPFLLFADPDHWILIDLKPIRQAVNSGQITLPEDSHHLKSLIEGFDYEIILPLDHPTTPNR